MHEAPDLVPGDDGPHSVGAENRGGGVADVQLGVIAGGRDHSLRVFAGDIAAEGALERPGPPGVGRDLLDIIAQGRDRDPAAQDGCIVLFRKIRLAEGGVHLLEVGHGPAQIFLGQLQAEVVIRLQEDGPAHHQALADRPVGGLAEVAALGVLGVCPASQDADLHVRDLRPGQDTAVAALLQVGQDQPLPVEGQVIDGAPALEDQAAPGLAGLQQEVDLRVVAQGLEVADALRGLRYGLPVDDAGLAEGHPHAEPVLDQPLQDLPLDLAHDLDRDLLFLLVIGEAEHGVLLLQGPQLPVGPVEILVRRQDQPALHDRLQKAARFLCARQSPQAHAGPGGGQARDRDDDARGSLLQGIVFFPLIKAQLGRLFRQALFVRTLGDLLPGQEDAACDLDPGQPGPAGIMGDLVDPGPEFRGTGRLRRQQVQQGQEVVHPLLLQRGSETDREELSL